MRTEIEIRKFMSDLMAGIKRKCDCAGTEHESGCRAGEKLMKLQYATLDWVLGDDGIQPIIDRLRQRIADDARRQ